MRLRKKESDTMDRQGASDALEVILMAAKGEIKGCICVNDLEVELTPETPAENVLDTIVTLANDALKHLQEPKRETWLDRLQKAWSAGGYVSFFNEEDEPILCLGKLLGYDGCFLLDDDEKGCKDCWQTPVDETHIRMEWL